MGCSLHWPYAKGEVMTTVMWTLSRMVTQNEVSSIYMYGPRRHEKTRILIQTSLLSYRDGLEIEISLVESLSMVL